MAIHHRLKIDAEKTMSTIVERLRETVFSGLHRKGFCSLGHPVVVKDESKYSFNSLKYLSFTYYLLLHKQGTKFLLTNDKYAFCAEDLTGVDPIGGATKHRLLEFFVSQKMCSLSPM